MKRANVTFCDSSILNLILFFNLYFSNKQNTLLTLFHNRIHSHGMEHTSKLASNYFVDICGHIQCLTCTLYVAV